MNNSWWLSLTDEGQLMLISLGLTIGAWLMVLIGLISCYCFGFPGIVQALLQSFKMLTYANGGILTVFLTHSTTSRIFGKTDNMKDIVEQGQNNDGK
jgi:hypothetical protein